MQNVGRLGYDDIKAHKAFSLYFFCDARETNVQQCIQKKLEQRCG